MERCLSSRILHPRLGATFAMVPLVTGALTVAEPVAIRLTTNWEYYWLSLFYARIGILGLLVPLAWLVIWGPVITWGWRRMTAVALLILLEFGVLAELPRLVLGYSAGHLCDARFQARLWLEMNTLCMDLVGLGCAVVAVFLVCIHALCFDPARRDATPCPNCGHDLGAQRRACCGKCGGEFTLGQLLASALRVRGAM